MGKQNCPGCGAAWNGRRCQSCGYEPFSEERSAEKSAPAPKQKRKHPIAGFFVLLLVIASLMPLLRSWGLRLKQIEQDSMSVHREYVSTSPEGSMLLYRDAQIEVALVWQNGQAFTGSIPVYLRNTSRRDITVSFLDIRINGMAAEPDSVRLTGKSADAATLLLQPGGSIPPEAVTDITFRLKICETDPARFLAEVSSVRLTTDS